VTVPRRTLDSASQNTGKQAAETELGQSVPGTPEPDAAVFNGLNKAGISHTSFSPPDTTGSIGPSHYVETLNGRVTVYNRAALAQVSTTTLDAFTARASSCDPQIQFDKTANRWFYAAIDCSNVAANFRLLFGWSKTADPSNLSTGWCRFLLNTSSTGTNTGLSDYPKLGHNSVNLIIGTNDFNSSGSFTTARVWMVPKPANGVTTCTPPTAHFTNPAGGLKNPDGSAAFTPVPANQVDNPANGYITAAHFPGGGVAQTKIALSHVAGTAAAPTYVKDGEVTVPAYNFPANVPQPGTTFRIDSSDTRLTQSVGRRDAAINAEAIWTQHTINGAGGRSVVRWYEINTATKTTRQVGTISSTSLFVFNGAIAPTNAGTSAAVINYNMGSATTLVSLRAGSRLSTSALNTMPQPVVVLANSNAADKDFSCSSTAPCRWGDYAGASPDLTNNNVVWGTNEVNGPTTSNPAWLTRNFALTP